MKKHFVEFLSPGTFVSETTVKEISGWDEQEAMQMARSIKERHGATPYGFQFFTRERGPNDLDSKITSRSGTFFLGGTKVSLDEIKARNDPSDRILISNMECNDWPYVVENFNSWKSVHPFTERDILLDFTP